MDLIDTTWTLSSTIMLPDAETESNRNNFTTKSWLVLGSNDSSLDVLNGDVLDVNVVSGHGLRKVYLHRLDLSGQYIVGLMIPVSIFPTGSVPIPPIL